jgi:type II secretion system protein H
MPMLLTGIKTHGRRAKGGFTLVELLVVLVIMVVMSGVVTVAMGPSLRDARMRSACRMVVSSLNYARSYAATSGKPARVIFDNKGQSVAVEVPDDASSNSEDMRTLTTSAGRRQSLPEDVAVSRIVKISDSQSEDYIEFDKLGEAEAAVIEIADTNGSKMYAVVDSITGRSRIYSHAELEESYAAALE